MFDTAEITGVYALWLTPDEETAAWIDDDFRREAIDVPGAVAVERLVDDEGSNLVLVWLNGSTTRADRLDELRRLLEERGAEVDADSGLYRRRSLVGRPEAADGVLAIRLRVQPGSEQHAREWLDEEHSLRQLTVPGSANFQGFERVVGTQPLLNIWSVADLAIIDSPEWVQMRATPWRDRFWTEVIETVPGRYVRTPDSVRVS